MAEITLTIRQTWTRLLVTARTAQPRSYSISASFVVSDEHILSYQYVNKPGHTVHLLRPVDDRFNVFIDLIRNDPRHKTQSFADGEFRYAVANNDAEGLSLWFYAFKSINVLALTLAPGWPSDLRPSIAGIEWPAPNAGPGTTS